MHFVLGEANCRNTGCLPSIFNMAQRKMRRQDGRLERLIQALRDAKAIRRKAAVTEQQHRSGSDNIPMFLHIRDI